MRIAVPIADGNVSQHFGHCEAFDLFDVDIEQQTITATHHVPAPPHAPGLLPGWLARNGADLVLAGGMGSRAQALFEEQGIRVVTGAPPEVPTRVVQQYLTGTLKTGTNICGH
jgi:ATP-binding protein involved in chromosome partitioning